MKMKLAAASVLVLLGSITLSVAGPPDGHGPKPPDTDEFVASDVGGGGWMHSGTFHPLDSDVILIGSDMMGEIFRTDDFGESWYPWNEGLANYDHMSRYVDDLIGVVEPDGTVAFYAATWAAPEKIDKKMTYVQSLAVDPRDRNVVYVGLRDQGMSLRAGLWRYDGRNWEHLSPDQPFVGMGIAVLEFNPCVSGQLLIGTDGQGLYIGEIGGED